MRSSRKQNEGWARRAGLPTRGELRGVITLVQEDRFRLEDERGRGYLLILGKKVALSQAELMHLCRGQTPVQVEYVGPPDLGAVATRVRPHTAAGTASVR